MKRFSGTLKMVSLLGLLLGTASAITQENLPALIKRTEPSVVSVLTYNEKGDLLKQGSGFFISKEGEVVTNYHVLQGASRAEVKTAQGKVFPLTHIIAEDREGDLIKALAGIGRESVPPLSVSPAIPEVGEKVLVIGSPMGLEKTAVDGIVSAVRDLPTFGKVIQITAPLSSGSSGSPVLNMKGEVIGVASFQIVDGHSLNFAIPGERIIHLRADSRKAFTEWAKEPFTEAEALFLSGCSFVLSSEYEKALSYFQEAIRIKPDFAEAHYNLGVVYGELGRHNDAISAYKEAIRIKPDFAEAHFGLGVAYGKLGRYNDAISAFQEAIRIKPDFAEAHYNLGVVYLVLGDKSSALEEYKILKNLDPELANRLFKLIYP